MPTDYKSIFNARGHLCNSATAMCPRARENELQAVLNLVDLTCTQTVCDIPAGGGFVAEGIMAAYGDKHAITCVEPAEQFAAAIAPGPVKMISPVDEIPVDDNSFSCLISLAGLHHAPDRRPIFKEWKRVCRPGAMLAVADVAKNTGASEFLNGFVDRHNPQGHKGLFFSNNCFSTLLNDNGFEVLSDECLDVPWLFDSREQMGAFCASLFGIQGVSIDAVIQELEKVVGVNDACSGEVALQWQLQYASGRLAA